MAPLRMHHGLPLGAATTSFDTQANTAYVRNRRADNLDQCR